MPVVAVTGAAGGIGYALTVRLAASAKVKKVIAIDGRRGDITGVTWRVADVRDPALAGRLTGVDVLVHADLDLAPDSDARTRRAFNVRGAQTVLTAAAAARVGRVVLLTSAMAYGARPDNPVPLPEDAPLAAEADSSVAGDLVEIEQLARRSPRANPGMSVTVVRPAALVGEGVQVGTEPGLHLPHHHRRRLGRARLGDAVGQQLNLAPQVRQGPVDAGQPEPIGAHGLQVVAAVGLRRDLAHHRDAADLVQRRHAGRADLAAGPDRDHPELSGLRPVKQLGHQRAVPLLEDVQRQAHAGKQHRRQREQRQHLAHIDERYVQGTVLWRRG